MADQPLVDGVTPVAPTQSASDTLSPAARAWKKRMAILGGFAYVTYLLWCIFLTLSMPSEALEPLAPFALASLAMGLLGLFAIVAFSLMRISQPSVPLSSRKRGLVFLVLGVLPGVAATVVAPFSILKEVPLSIDLLEPTAASELVAPLSATFSVEALAERLKSKGFEPVQFRWDANGDGIIDQDTASPRMMANYERQGVQKVSVQMITADKQMRIAKLQFVITRSVFSNYPMSVVVNRPTILSVAHLVPDPSQLQEVQWDFNHDGKPDETTTQLEITHSFFSTGKTYVTAIVILKNGVQARYDRAFDVGEPPKLPFPVTMISQPSYLLSPPPFSTLWRVQTKESIGQVLWDFGDGERAEGESAAHTFNKQGSFAVTAKVFARSGSSATLSAIVQVVESLHLPDLHFEGSPQVEGNRISGEVPLSLSLQPKTSVPFVQFSWEAPDATEVGATETNLQAIFRREGMYTVTLIAHDAENRVLRLPISVEVEPPSSVLSIQMNPDSGLAPLLVKLDASETFIPGETITGFEWSFGDNSSSFIGGARTEHTFTQEGTYSINLNIKTTSGRTYQTTKALSVRSPMLSACILASRVSGTAPLGIQFDSSCSVGNPAGYLWDFGDGAQTDEHNPVHVFSKPGQYAVKLTVTDATRHTSDQAITVTVKP